MECMFGDVLSSDERELMMRLGFRELSSYKTDIDGKLIEVYTFLIGVDRVNELSKIEARVFLRNTLAF